VNESRQQSLAMIFDLDGVLIHSMPMHVRAWNRYLEGFGKSCGEIERVMHGKRNSELVRELFGNDLADEVIFEHGAAKERLFRQMLIESDLGACRVRGLPEFLERYKHVPKAIASNAERANIEFIVERFGLSAYFQVIVNGQQVQRPKPFPDVYWKAAELLGIEPRACIVFEDSPTGVEAAQAAGMRVVGVETTPTEFNRVNLKVQDFSDPRLEEWIQGQLYEAGQIA
jgi:HAD superfamily hydrolase (TIGR01509 family)